VLNFFERLLNTVAGPHICLNECFGAAGASLPKVEIEHRGALSSQQPANSFANPGAASRNGNPQAARQRSGWRCG
jgi:hypothetical protein